MLTVIGVGILVILNGVMYVFVMRYRMQLQSMLNLNQLLSDGQLRVEKLHQDLIEAHEARVKIAVEEAEHYLNKYDGECNQRLIDKQRYEDTIAGLTEQMEMSDRAVTLLMNVANRTVEGRKMPQAIEAADPPITSSEEPHVITNVPAKRTPPVKRSHNTSRKR